MGLDLQEKVTLLTSEKLKLSHGMQAMSMTHSQTNEENQFQIAKAEGTAKAAGEEMDILRRNQEETAKVVAAETVRSLRRIDQLEVFEKQAFVERTNFELQQQLDDVTVCTTELRESHEEAMQKCRRR